jgi:hypothetical protein
VLPLVLYGSIPSVDTPWHWEYSPMWLPATLTGSSFGLDHPDSWEIFTLQDEVTIDPALYLAFGGYAVGTLIGARRLGHPAGSYDRPLMSRRKM